MTNPTMTTSAMTRVTILGATGSVGEAVLDVIAENPDRLCVETLVAGRDALKLAALARRHRARQVVVEDEVGLPVLREALAGTGIGISAGRASVIAAAAADCDIVVAAITGVAGLEPTLSAVRAGRIVALANKESLVAAGPLVMAAARKGQILPLDSEHNALMQALGGHDIADVASMVLTASGGPFRNWSAERIAGATIEDALAHPNWRMGRKITIDSATMMNKGLELIEAKYLFGLAPDQLDVLVHPQSIVHGLVTFRDGAVSAGMAVPDMRVPTAHCLGLGRRFDAPQRRLDLASIGTLSFEAPDELRFPALGLARSAMQSGGAMPIVLNAANEVAVEAFLAGKIRFGAIAQMVSEACAAAGSHCYGQVASLESVLFIDQDTRRRTSDALSQPLFAVT
ncbi:MAG: 1-deoxy-D-xylulose-5-phosphate reductoisomerase [Bosea sp. (in: a-proteobacteria)]